jgi:hypothetical protein
MHNPHAMPPWCDLPRPDSLPVEEKRILEVLIPCVGRARAIGKRKLTIAAGMVHPDTEAPNERRARDALYRLIVDQGVPVCLSTSSTNGGYFLPANRAEVEAAAETIQSYIDHHQERLDAYKAALGKNQSDLFGDKY